MSNTARILEDLLSLEAWYEPLVYQCESPLKVALSFSDARYSGGQESPIEFSVELKRAVLVVVCDEKLAVPREGRLRQYPSRQMTIRQVEGNETQAAEGEEDIISGKAKIDEKGPGAEVLGTFRNTSGFQKTNQDLHESSETLSQKIEMTYRAAGKEHQWDCRPISEKTLQGTAQDGGQAMLRLKPTSDVRLEDFGVRVFVKCKSDDFEISDISIKPSWKERLSGKEDLQRRLDLARAVIKAKLAEAQLEVTDLEPKYADVVIADVLAVTE